MKNQGLFQTMDSLKKILFLNLSIGQEIYILKKIK